MVNVLNKQTLPVQIYRILRTDILNQDISCGTKLTLQSLKDRFGVSHTPIREVLTHLVDDGLVIYYSNVGVSVIPLDAKDIQDIFGLDYEFECIAIKMVSRNKTMDALLNSLAANIEECEQMLTKGKISEWGGGRSPISSIWRFINTRIIPAESRIITIQSIKRSPKGTSQRLWKL